MGKIVALLGGGAGRVCYRYCDFGGGLDGGSARFGGPAHKKTERRWPHMGAFRELAEEFFGLHGDEARALAAKIWQASSTRLIGGEPVQHGSHLLFLLPAETVLDAIQGGFCSDCRLPCKYWTGAEGSCRKGDFCRFRHGDVRLTSGHEGIDALAERFRPNSEVSDV